MPKFSGPRNPTRAAPGPVQTSGQTQTYEGGAAYELDAKGELFTLAVTNFVEPTFYERSKDRQDRFVKAIHRCVREDPAWVAGLAKYARDAMQMRSASVVLACEYVRGGGPGGRKVVDSVCLRADEPAEVLAYWMAHYGRQVPAAIKRGVADAAQRLYTERAALRYDSQNSAMRMADVLELAHVAPKDDRQSQLFKHLIDKRHNRDNWMESATPGLATVYDWTTGGAPFDSIPPLVSWERLSTYHKMDAVAWETVIPQMGAMALVRNLRNFDAAGISDTAADLVESRLKDPEEIRKSRQLPFRMYTAWREVNSLRWGPALERAIKHATANIPRISGSTLILSDVSGSMAWKPLSARGSVYPWEVGAVFAGAAAQACDQARVVAFATTSAEMGEIGDILRFVPKMQEAMSKLGGGTNLYSALAEHYRGEDRVVVFTDMQAHDCWKPQFEKIPNIYCWDLSGYGKTGLDLSKPGRYQFGGFSDACFQMFGLLEMAQRCAWPWKS